MNNLLSIIVPTFNTEKYIEKCVKSLIRQTYRNIEIILVDDGSTDTSPKLCDILTEKYPNVYVVHKDNGGLISAWTTGVKACHGSFVGFIDSDDYVQDDYYEILMHPVDQYECDISMCGFSLEGESNLKIKAAGELETGLYEGDALEQIKNQYFYKAKIQNSRCLKVYRKTLLLDNLKYLDESVVLGEDMTITVPTVLDSSRLFINQEYFGYHYRIYTSSMSHSLKQGQVSNFLKLYNLVSHEFIEKGYMNEYVDHEFHRQMISVVGLIIFSNNESKEKIKLLQLLRNSNEAEHLLQIKNVDMKRSWHLLSELFRYRKYYSLCFFGYMKQLINR